MNRNPGKIMFWQLDPGTAPWYPSICIFSVAKFYSQICPDLYLPIYLRGGGEQGDAYPGLEDHIRNQEKAWKCF